VKPTRGMVSVKHLHIGRAHYVLPIEQCRLFALMPLLPFGNNGNEVIYLSKSASFEILFRINVLRYKTTLHIT